MSQSSDNYWDENGPENEEELVERDLPQDDEEEGEDLFDEQNIFRDYESIPALDRYEEEEEGVMLDEPPVAYEEQQRARRAAERVLDRRDRPGQLQEDDDDVNEDGQADMEVGSSDDEQKDGDETLLGGLAERGKVEDWIAKDVGRTQIHTKFTKFLLRYRDDSGERIYVKKLEILAQGNGCSLEVDLDHLSSYMSKEAVWLLDVPKQMLEIFGEATREYLLDKYNYDQLIDSDKIFVRIINMNMSESIRDLRVLQLDRLVAVEGVVTRRTSIYPQLSTVKFNCMKCGYILGPFQQNGEVQVQPKICSNCDGKGPFDINMQQTMYRNYQKINLQESPGKVPPGRLPRSKEVILLHDLIDTVRPGEEVCVVGVYLSNPDIALNIKSGFPLLHTYIEANNVIKQQEQFSLSHITDEDKQRIHQLAKRPDLGDLIMTSIAPSIYGHEDIKQCICLALFGGEEKYHRSQNNQAMHRIRGDINILLLGDPGTAKSQFLKYVEKTAHRVVSTTGKGASAVGLTAAVHKDPVTKEWTLEGGALVLADKGMCLIDEFDKMNDHDRVSIHEAMEQQSISISKAGIVTQLQARCCVIAAANPTSGRYISSRTFAENVQLSDPILSRFDVLCVVKDVIDPVADEKLAAFVVQNHANYNNPLQNNAPQRGLDQELLKKYIAYAKMHCHPKWASNQDNERIVQVYEQLRSESSLSHAMPITVRHLEAMIRMAEASAKMHLRPLVQDRDIKIAIKLMLRSFVSTQKFSVQKRLEKKFGQYLVANQEDEHELLLKILQQLLTNQLNYQQLLNEGQQPDQHTGFKEISIDCRKLKQEASVYRVGNNSLNSFYHSQLLFNAGFFYDADGQYIAYLPQ